MKYQLSPLLALTLACGTSAAQVTTFQCTARGQPPRTDISAGDDCFTLPVFRMNRFQQPVMRFSPLGETVIPTVVPAVFHPLPTPGPLHRLLAWT